MPQAATTRAQRWLVTALIGGCAALEAVLLAGLAFSKVRLNADFMAFWSLPRFAVSQPITRLYDPQAVQAFQQGLYPGFHSYYPFTYAPDFLLACWWLLYLPYGAARIAWALEGLAVAGLGVGLLFRGRRAWICGLAILASPAALLNLVIGQTGLLSAGLLFAGLGLLPRRPVLAGIAFGLLTLKPQFGVLVAVLLLARGEWRAILAACGVTALLVGASCLIFPPELWPLWLASLPAYQHDYFDQPALNLAKMVTPAANLVLAGVPRGLAAWLQGVCTLGVAGAVFVVARRAPHRLAAAAVLAGTCLAVPHAYAYDTLPLIAALVLCLQPRTPAWQLMLGAALYLGPLLLLTGAAHMFLYAPAEAWAFIVIIALALRHPSGAISADEPDDRSAAGA